MSPTHKPRKALPLFAISVTVTMRPLKGGGGTVSYHQEAKDRSEALAKLDELYRLAESDIQDWEEF